MPKNTENFISKRAIPGVILTPSDGYYKIRKIGLTGDRVKVDPAFHNTRKQAKEFGSIINWLKPIVNHLLMGKKIKGARSRFTGALVKAIMSDNSNELGNRKLAEGDWKALIGFEFNTAATWHKMVHAEGRTLYNHSKGEIQYVFPAIVPAVQVKAPPEVTHYRVKATVVSITDAQEVNCLPWQQSTILPCKEIRMPAIKMNFNVAKTGTALHLVVIYMQWYTKELKSGRVNKSTICGSMYIIDVCR
jgi:hypothetical protein